MTYPAHANDRNGKVVRTGDRVSAVFTRYNDRWVGFGKLTKLTYGAYRCPLATVSLDDGTKEIVIAHLALTREEN